MKLIARNGNSLRIRAKHTEIRGRLAWPPDFKPVYGEPNLLSSGAKAYYRRGGVWLINGYAMDGSDITKLRLPI